MIAKSVTGIKIAAVRGHANKRRQVATTAILRYRVSLYPVRTITPSGELFMRSGALLALLILALLPGVAASDTSSGLAPNAVQGVIDLRDWDFAAQGNVALSGEWHFYEGGYVSDYENGASTPGIKKVKKVPANWGLREPANAPGEFGFGTYELTVLLPKQRPELGIRLKTVSSAYVLSANGQPVASAGRVGTTAAESSSQYRPQVSPLPELGDTLVLRMDVANFDHARGGLWDTVRLGPTDSLIFERRASLYIAASLASAALMIGLYHLFIWLLRPRDMPSLVFALLCAGLAVRLVSVNELLILQLAPTLGHSALLRAEYLSMALLIGFGVIFLRQVVEDDLPRRYVVAVAGVCLAYALVILTTSPVVFTRLLILIHLLLGVVAVLTAVATVRAIRRKVQGIWLYAISCILLILVTAHDVFVNTFSRVPPLDFGVGDNDLVAFGFVAVVFAQAIVLAIRSASAMDELEVRSLELSSAKDELDGYARDLEARVLKRTADLKAANVQLERLSRIDGLTNLYNRREFDLRIESDWADHVRRQAELSLILIDVDNFKGYNDHYGHGAGDDTLVAIGGALKSAVSRPTDLVARYGGEELVVLLPNTDRNGALLVAEQLRKAVQSLEITHSETAAGVVTISLGVATTVPARGASADDFLDAADQALYRAKEQGRNQVAAA